MAMEQGDDGHTPIIPYLVLRVRSLETGQTILGGEWQILKRSIVVTPLIIIFQVLHVHFERYDVSL